MSRIHGYGVPIGMPTGQYYDPEEDPYLQSLRSRALRNAAYQEVQAGGGIQPVNPNPMAVNMDYWRAQEADKASRQAARDDLTDQRQWDLFLRDREEQKGILQEQRQQDYTLERMGAQEQYQQEREGRLAQVDAGKADREQQHRIEQMLLQNAGQMDIQDAQADREAARQREMLDRQSQLTEMRSQAEFDRTMAHQQYVTHRESMRERMRWVQQGLKEGTLFYGPDQRQQWYNNQIAKDSVRESREIPDNQKPRLLAQLDEKDEQIMVSARMKAPDDRPVPLQEHWDRETLWIDQGDGTRIPLHRSQQKDGGVSWEVPRNFPIQGKGGKGEGEAGMLKEETLSRLQDEAIKNNTVKDATTQAATTNWERANEEFAQRHKMIRDLHLQAADRGGVAAERVNQILSYYGGKLPTIDTTKADKDKKPFELKREADRREYDAELANMNRYGAGETPAQISAGRKQQSRQQSPQQGPPTGVQPFGVPLQSGQPGPQGFGEQPAKSGKPRPSSGLVSQASAMLKTIQRDHPDGKIPPGQSTQFNWAMAILQAEIEAAQ